MNLESIVGLVRDLSVLGAALMAIYGIDAWRREHVGKRQIELAEEALAAFYEARDALSYIRSPMSFGFERQELDRGEHESDEEYESRRNASVVFYRFEQRQELFSSIHSLRYRFAAQFGEDRASPFVELWAVRSDVLSAAQRLARYWPQNAFRDEEQRAKHFERVEKQEQVFWEDYSDDDPIKKRVNDLVVDLESTCRAAIEGKGTLFGLINKKL